MAGTTTAAAVTAAAGGLRLIGPTAFRTFRCVWMLEELGIAYDHDKTAAPWSDQAKQSHPMGKIPSLIVDRNGGNSSGESNQDSSSFTLYESAAINTYLCDEQNRFIPPPRTPERAIYDRTILFIMSELDSQSLWIHRKHAMLHHVFGKSDVAVDAAKEQFRRANNCLVDQLNPYLLGDEFSAADVLYVHCLDWATTIGWTDTWDGSSGDKVDAYLRSCHDRPAYRRANKIRDAEREARKKTSTTTSKL